MRGAWPPRPFAPVPDPAPGSGRKLPALGLDKISGQTGGLAPEGERTAPTLAPGRRKPPARNPVPSPLPLARGRHVRAAARPAERPARPLIPPTRPSTQRHGPMKPVAGASGHTHAKPPQHLPGTLPPAPPASHQAVLHPTILLGDPARRTTSRPRVDAPPPPHYTPTTLTPVPSSLVRPDAPVSARAPPKVQLGVPQVRPGARADTPSPSQPFADRRVRAACPEHGESGRRAGACSARRHPDGHEGAPASPPPPPPPHAPARALASQGDAPCGRRLHAGVQPEIHGLPLCAGPRRWPPSSRFTADALLPAAVPLTAAQALRRYSQHLSEFEYGEVLEYKKVWFAVRDRRETAGGACTQRSLPPSPKRRAAAARRCAAPRGRRGTTTTTTTGGIIRS